MTNKVYFANDGIIDVTAMTSFGVSVKENDSPIGFFGTGFKYAIAILLRKKHKITVQAGDTEYVFTKEPKYVRGKFFNFVTMNGQQLGYTTEYGKTWEMWQAYRELYCNTLDEGGVITTNRDEIKDRQTIVTVEGAEFYDVHNDKNHIILSSKHLYNASPAIHIHANSTRSIFYKTIRKSNTF